jgi:hypothetical protein
VEVSANKYRQFTEAAAPATDPLAFEITMNGQLVVEDADMVGGGNWARRTAFNVAETVAPAPLLRLRNFECAVAHKLIYDITTNESRDGGGPPVVTEHVRGLQLHAAVRAGNAPGFFALYVTGTEPWEESWYAPIYGIVDTGAWVMRVRPTFEEEGVVVNQSGEASGLDVVVNTSGLEFKVGLLDAEEPSGYLIDLHWRIDPLTEYEAALTNYQMVVILRQTFFLKPLLSADDEDEDGGTLEEWTDWQEEPVWPPVEE